MFYSVVVSFADCLKDLTDIIESESCEVCNSTCDTHDLTRDTHDLTCDTHDLTFDTNDLTRDIALFHCRISIQ